EMPLAEYPTHENGTCAVTGGYVYRGQAHPAMVGGYFYADYCGGQIWALAPSPDGTWQSTLLLDTDLSISSFGEDEAGELYITTFDGVLYRLVAVAP
ncbi:MAG: glucose dehydrogenase, partial [Chloroflexota bacterium]